MTYILMGVFLILYVAVVAAGMKYTSEKHTFFDSHDVCVMKGMFSIIVILVHIPLSYQNRIQDMMGSFAYIGVTFFFMASGFGLKWGMVNKKDYINAFWVKRLPKILLPALFCNFLHVIINVYKGVNNITIWSFLSIDAWVRVLLLYYFLFWLVYYIFHKLNIEGDFKDIIICLVVVSCSLIDRLTPLKLTLIWPTESLGFAYGIILFHYLDRLKKWSGEGWLAKSGYLILLGGITGSAYLKFKTVEFWGDYCLKIFLGIVLLTLMLHLTVRMIIGNKVNIFLGEIS